MAIYVDILPKELREELNKYRYLKNTCDMKNLLSLFYTSISLEKYIENINNLFKIYKLKTRLYVDLFENLIFYKLDPNDLFPDEFVIQFIQEYVKICIKTHDSHSLKGKSQFPNEYMTYRYNGIRFDISTEHDYHMYDVLKVLHKH